MADTITAAQAAKRLGINLRTLWRWRDAGKIAEAGRHGRTVMFNALDVDRLRGVDVAARLTMADVYVRLAGIESWEDVDALKRDVAATICHGAEGDARDAIEASYRAAQAMAATHPDEDARDRWTRTARQYGAWLDVPTEETDRAIERKANTITYRQACEQYELAPKDPAYIVAVRTF